MSSTTSALLMVSGRPRATGVGVPAAVPRREELLWADVRRVESDAGKASVTRLGEDGRSAVPACDALEYPRILRRRRHALAEEVDAQ